MLLSKEKLLTINELELTGIINKMDFNQYSEYCKCLDEFIENFPIQENKLKTTFGAKDHNSVSEILSSIHNSLTKIHANDLARNCRKLSSEIGTSKYESAEANLTSFLTAITSLSIAIQMAQHNNTALNETESARADENNGGQQEQKSILAVDDVSLLLNTLKLSLQNTEYRFTGVTSGVAALKFIESHKPDLFILDIAMPKMNGYELARKIRERGHEAPIIFLTGSKTREYVLKAIQIGAADFIIKPIDMKDMLDKIKKYLG